MIRHLSLVVIALLSCAAGSAACAVDTRIRTLRYDPNQIVTVPGKSNIQSTIEFGSDEHIESVAVGNSAAWQVTPNHRASLLFVKPLVSWSRTNMTVVTDKRTYMFDLVTGRYGPAPFYSLKFSYPERPVDKAELEKVVVVTPAPTPAPTPVQLNFNWRTKGAADLIPVRTFDDGTALYLAWTPNVALPAVSTLAEDGREASLNYRLADNYIVVAPVPSNILLRYGKKTATAFRIVPEGPSPRHRSEVLRQAETHITQPPIAPASAVPPAVPSRPSVAGRSQVATAAAMPVEHPGVSARLTYPTFADDHVTDEHHE